MKYLKHGVELMAVNINEAIMKIRAAGPANVRSTPMEGQNVHTGQYQIEVKESDMWVPVAIGITKTIADNIISQAVNRVICG